MTKVKRYTETVYQMIQQNRCNIWEVPLSVL